MTIRVDWTTIDWRKDDFEIARELGCHYVSVANWRRRCKLNGAAKHHREKWQRWDRVDWSKHNDDIAKELRVSPTTVNMHRRQRGERPCPVKPQSRPCTYDWGSVNWLDRDVDIARQLGCSKQRVQQVRQQLRVGDSPNKRRSSTAIQFDKWIAKNNKRLRNMTLAEIADAIGMSAINASKRLRYRGVQYQVYVPTAKRMPINWDLPNRDLGPLWWPHCRTYKAQSVRVSKERVKHGHPARWDARQHIESDPAYHAALRAEKKAAKRWFSQATPTTERQHTA